MARSKAKAASSDDTVLLVATSRETRESLGTYLAESDVTFLVRSTLEPAAELVSTVRAIVLFPDDFGEGEVMSYLSLIRARRPDLTVLVVTRSPSRYKSVTAAEKRSLPVIVVPRPAFGWTLLDLVREVLAQGQRS